MLFEIKENDKTFISQLKTIRFSDINWSEKDLENLISSNISSFIPENQLMLLSQERPFQEEADILALDMNGTLYIFELKKWASYKENLLQVLRYGQIFGQYDYYRLESMLRKYMKDDTINLTEKHLEYFKERRTEKLEINLFNKEQRFVVITNGVDFETLNAVKYWKDKGSKIDCLPYRIYQSESKIYFEFSTFNPENEIIVNEDSEFYIVNTNITWSNENYKEMLSENKASAYGNRRYGIKRIKKNDEVFLYHNGVGVVAYGKAIDNPVETPDEEIYIKVNFKWKVDPDSEPKAAVSAS